MKDLVEFLSKNLAGYLPVLISVIAAPNRSVSKLIADGQDRLNRALLFGGITIAIGFAFQAPLLHKDQNFATIAGSILAFKIVAILIFSWAILLAFRLMGGKGSYETTLCAYLYVVSPLYLLWILLNVVNIGILSTYDPALAMSWRSGQFLTADQIKEFTSTTPLRAASFMLLVIIQTFCTPAWFAIYWGTFRGIHQVSLFRATLAFLISVVVCYAFFVLSVLMLQGLHSGGLPSIA